MFKFITTSVFVLFLNNTPLFSQTIDYFPKTFSGSMSASGGAGYAITEGVNAIQHNPAGINNSNNSTELLLNFETEYYSYHVLNYLHNREVGRTFYHDKLSLLFPQVSMKFQIYESIAIGLGLTNYLTPYISNSKRAVTWSPMYDQVTKGNIQSAILGISYKFNDFLRLGANISKYWGTVSSDIEGDNHYTDLGKILEIKTELSGMNTSFGAQLHFKKISCGVNIISPIKFNTDISYFITSDSLFKSLIPTNLNPEFQYPFNFGIGIATELIDNWNFVFDVKTYNMSESEFSFNIYDYGDNYNWQDGIGYSSGLIYSPEKRPNTKYKFGYAYIPQTRTIYNISDSNDIYGILNSGQNVKHMLTIGSQIELSKITFDYGLKYSLLKWHRDYQFEEWIIEDEYREQEIGIFFNILYKTINKKGRV
jgi:hypothetical protein